MARPRKLASLTASVLVSAGTLLSLQTPASAAPNHQVPFGCGTTVTASTWSGHNPANAVDFQKTGIRGMPVLASAPGTVTVVGNTGSTSYGRWIEIDHGGGNRTRYAHLDSQRVTQGQSVGQGTVIGTAGATGGVTGPHLHYEQRQNGTVVRVVLDGVAVPYFAKTDFTSRNACGGNPYTPQQVCGSDYSVIDSAALGTVGRVYLLYDASDQNNCVVTLKSASVGTPTATSAFLTVEGASRVTDSGSYAYYAGPVRRFAGGTCVQWGGSMGSTAYESPFEHCG